MSKNKILFILKRREDYSAPLHSTHRSLSTGLFNSVSFLDDMLRDSGVVESNMEVAIDNNCIDRLVTKHRPTHVIIEALWVVPSKFEILSRLHPKVTWIIRLHSELPFIANEGMAMDWIAEYAKYPNLVIGANAPRMFEEVKIFLRSIGYSGADICKKVTYMPNFYPQGMTKKKFELKDNTINISCFGAVRPLKNHLLQAVAAVKFANKIGCKLRFHINGTRLEMKGEPVLNNLKGMFKHLEGKHELVSHEWMNRDDFLKLCSTMDIAMQVSFSETFNIVAADQVVQGVPIVISREVPWAAPIFCADPTNLDDIVCTLHRTMILSQINVWMHQGRLLKYTNKTRDIWLEYFEPKLSEVIQPYIGK